LLAKGEAMNPVIHLQELARQVRGNTLHLLTAVPEGWLTWAPEGTSNHILWHAGHALWVQDVLCIQPLTGRGSELPDGWDETFGSDCRPVRTTTDWPPRDQVLSLLESQQARLLELFETHAERLARIGPDPPNDWDLTRGIIHGLHDEARHQGEMHLLLKLRRAHHGSAAR
jgi:hypothetical protein